LAPRIELERALAGATGGGQTSASGEHAVSRQARGKLRERRGTERGNVKRLATCVPEVLRVSSMLHNVIVSMCVRLIDVAFITS